MVKLDKEFVEECGLGGLSADRADQFLAWFYGQLEVRVGMRLANAMTDEQLDQFEALITADDEAGALGWLEANYPNYPDVVREELEKLKFEVIDRSSDLVVAANT